MACGDLCIQVALALFRRADVVEQQAENVILQLAAGDQLDGGNADAFLVNLAADAHRSGIRPADIGMVSARSDIESRPGRALPPSFVEEHRGNQRDVRKVRAAAK